MTRRRTRTSTGNQRPTASNSSRANRARGLVPIDSRVVGLLPPESDRHTSWLLGRLANSFPVHETLVKTLESLSTAFGSWGRAWEAEHNGRLTDVVYQDRDPTRLPDSKPDDPGEHESHAASRQPGRRGESQGTRQGEYRGPEENLAVERGPRSWALQDGAEPDSFRLAPGFSLRLGYRAR